jgi:hypothetical protein
MKKALLWTFVTLLVMLALVSCDNVIGGLGGAKVEYDQNGNRLVEVNIINNMGRSITDTFAKADANYIEVIFKKGTNYYQASGFRTLALSVRIPVGDYVAGDAILLLGKRVGNDYTLLATGVLTGNPTLLAPLEVETTTDTISFTVTSIETFLSAGAASPSFEIDEESGTATAIEDTVFDGKTADGLFNGSKCFQVPSSTSDIAASLSFTGFDDTGASIVVKGSPDVTFEKISAGVGNNITATVTAPTTNMSGGVISFTFTSLADSDYKITFDVPVSGFATTGNGLDNAIIWNIKGGTDKDLAQGLDLGATATKADGVVLIVRSSLDEFVTPGIGTPVWP